MINYGTKFKLGDRVRITYGLHKGKVGKFVNFLNYVNNGMADDSVRRGIQIPSAMYVISCGWFRENIYCNEIDLEAVDP